MLRKKRGIIKYNENQWRDLYKVILSNSIYYKNVLELFSIRAEIEDEYINRILNPDFCDVYNKMTNFKFFSEDVKKVKKVRSIIFRIHLNRLPLYVNDPVTGPIAKWRLINGK
jgi:hypothetical protein